MPPGQGNPFWSQRVRAELTLREARPMELPAVPTDDELEDHGGQAEAGRQDQSRGREVSRPRRNGVRSSDREPEPVMGERFATPLRAPSSWIKSESSGMQQHGTRTEGPLPASGEVDGAEVAADGLQVELEKLVVEKLKEENLQLREALEALKRKQPSEEQSSSNSSWVELGDTSSIGASGVPPPPPNTPRMTVMEPSVMDQGSPKHTPGGTQVPVGPPPATPPSVREVGSGWMDDLQNYEWVPQSVSWKGRGGLRDESPPAWMKQADRKALDRVARLEHEILELRAAVDKPDRERMRTLMERDVSGSWSNYWGHRAHQWQGGSGQQAAAQVLQEEGRSLAADAVPHRDRAFQHDAVPHRDRAFPHDDLPHRDRAFQHDDLSHRDRAFQHDDLSHRDRAFQHDALPHRDRAFQHDALPHRDRAFLHGAELHQDRAFLHGAELHQDRAFRRDGLPQQARANGHGWEPSYHGRGQGQGLSHELQEGQERWSGQSKAPGLVPPFPMSNHETGGGGSKLELPVLEACASPMDLGDWLTLCGPVMRDLSPHSAKWWERTLQEAERFYAQWKISTPLARVQIKAVLPLELAVEPYVRTEQRGVSLLLKAVPQEIKQLLVSNRDVSSTAILWRLLVTFQPGGAGEKGQLLRSLTSMSGGSSAADLATSLRQWRRAFQRACLMEPCWFMVWRWQRSG